VQREGGGGAGSPESNSRGSASLELAKLGPPGWDPSGKRIREVRHNTRNPPSVTVGLTEALGRKPTGDSGSARRDSPACAFTRRSGPENGGKKFWVRALCKNDPESALSGAV
jgi:hypothetical protein